MKTLAFQHPTESFSVRRVEHNNEDWFIARDICDSLGIEQTNKGIEKLDPDEVHQMHLIDTMKRSQLTYIVSESGLYAMILRSDKPAARAFRKWVTSEVLPSLRRQGVYSLVGQLPLESIRVRRLELQLRAAKLREQAVCLELQSTILDDIPGAVAVNHWVTEHKPEFTGRKLGNIVRSIRRWAVTNKHPLGHIRSRRSDKQAYQCTLAMLPEHIAAYFAQPA